MSGKLIRRIFGWLGAAGILLASTPVSAAVDLLEPDTPDDVVFGEMGSNDFRLSDMGPNGNTAYGAYAPAIAYNNTNNQYLVVWYGEDNSDGMVDGEFEVFGQRVDAVSGAEIGNDFRISAMGPDGNTAYYAANPDVAYNRTNNQYLVVWSGANTLNKTEIWGQRLNAATGAPVGSVFRIGSMGVIGDTNYDAYFPSAAWNSIDNEYLVVWTGDDNTRGTTDEEYEVFGQRVEGDTASLIGGNVRISEMGPNLNAAYDANTPDVAYNAFANNYWVTWSADDNTDGIIDEENEIFVQRINAATGAETGPTDYRISTMGPNGNANYDAMEPQAACSTLRNECLFTWYGDHNTNGQLDNEYEVFTQRVSGPTPDSLSLFGQQRISAMGGLGDANYDGQQPHVAYNSTADEYLVAWYGLGVVRTYDQSEVFVQRVNGFNQQINDEIAVSDMGPDSVNTLTAQSAALAFNEANFEYLVVWFGDDNIAPLVNDELEVFGQRLGAGTLIDIMLPLVIR